MSEFWSYLKNSLLSDCDSARKEWAIANMDTYKKSNIYFQSINNEVNSGDYLDIDNINRSYKLREELRDSIVVETKARLRLDKLTLSEKNIRENNPINYEIWYFGK
jgi:hypothetical protein